MANSEEIPYLVRPSRGNIDRGHMVTTGGKWWRFHQKRVIVFLVVGSLQARNQDQIRRDGRKGRTEKTTALSRVDTFKALEIASGVWVTRPESFLVFMADGFQLAGRIAREMKPAGNHVRNELTCRSPFWV